DARTWHDDVPHANFHVVDPDYGPPSAHGYAGPCLWPVDALHRPQLRWRLLRPDTRRKPASLAKRLLVLFASRRLHHDPAGLRDYFGDRAGIQPQAALRLQGHGVVVARDRCARVYRVGPPHVHYWRGAQALVR